MQPGNHVQIPRPPLPFYVDESPSTCGDDTLHAHVMSTPSSDSGLATTFTSYKVSLAAISKWPPPNFTDPDRRRWLVPYVIVLQVLSTLIVGARVWTRLNKRAGAFGWHDVLIILATVSQSR